MNAYKAMVSILDINETLEAMKQNNTKDYPDMISCKAQELLVEYRDILVAEMKRTVLEVYNDDK